MTPPDSGPVTVHLHQTKRRWQWWRDIVLLLLTSAVLALTSLVVNLAHSNDGLQRQIATSAAARTRQFEDLTAQLTGLQARLGKAQATAAAKDARIKQLTDQLFALGVRPAPDPTVKASASSGPSPVLLPLPFPQPTPAPAPRPRPTPTPTATRTPTPTPICLLEVGGVCLIQEPST